MFFLNVRRKTEKYSLAALRVIVYSAWRYVSKFKLKLTNTPKLLIAADSEVCFQMLMGVRQKRGVTPGAR